MAGTCTCYRDVPAYYEPVPSTAARSIADFVTLYRGKLARNRGPISVTAPAQNAMLFHQPRSYGYAYFNRRCRWLNCSRRNVAIIFGSEMPAHLRRSSPKTGQRAATQYVCQTSWQSVHSHRWRCRNTIIITVQTICMKSVTGCFQWHAIIEGCIPVTYRVAQKVGTIFVLLNFTKY